VRLRYFSSRRDKYGYIHPSAIVLMPSLLNKQNIFLFENTNIGENATILSNAGKFIMKKNSIAGPGLTVICQNHNIYDVGSYPGDENWSTMEIKEDVIIDDGVWLGANVTLCPGVHIERGCIVGAGSVCPGKRKYPPYAIIGGNPAKVLKFRFTLEQQIEHEIKNYKEEERIARHVLKNNYEKYNCTNSL
jgi:acetyltransferase-like isoleucine patch superfamily enzyme